MVLGRYMHWLHTRWPAGTVEKMPEVAEDGRTTVEGVRIVGDLTGIPLLKFSADTGARAVQAFLAEGDFAAKKGKDGDFDVAIIGAGVSGISAAIEAKKAGLRYVVYEAAERFNTIQNFPKGKPIYTYPTEMTPAGEIRFKAEVKEDLLAELETQTSQHGVEITHARVEKIARGGGLIEVHLADKKVVRALRCVVAIGRSGNYRKLGVPGENLDKVYHRLYDPKEYAGKNVLVVGGGDSALESAIALAISGAHVTLSHRKKEFARPKPENVEKVQKLVANPMAHVGVERPTSDRVNTAVTPDMLGDHPKGSLTLALGSKLGSVESDHVVITLDGQKEPTKLPNDVVFAMIGREAPLDFFRRSGIEVRGDRTAKWWIGLIAFFLFCVWLYNWKSGGVLAQWWQARNWFPYNVADLFGDGGSVLKTAVTQPGFYYSLAYCLAVVIFGIRRIQRRETPYVRNQTLSLMAFQVIPLFLLPYFVFPWMGAAGWFDDGAGRWFADQFFPDSYAPFNPAEREYWRSFGFILAWPLFIWNFFTDKPTAGWLIVGSIQTFVIIPLLIRRYGKGVYCGWICSCGALAETLGDAHRTKMPHGPIWNRLNMIGQVFLGAAVLLLITRVIAWVIPGNDIFQRFHGKLLSNDYGLDYYHVVDIWWAGIIGVGLYFHFSGRVWCRFACPLAALMHIYARFSTFRIFADKKKCISCNVCTSVCHQGIDVMNFANKGLAMEDPECVRCSACVASCPTGTLTFGRLGPGGAPIHDATPASLVQMREGKKKLRIVDSATPPQVAAAE